MRESHLETDQKTKYIRENFSLEDELLVQIRNDCLVVNRPINITPEEGKLLQVLIKLGNYKNILEIGTFYGYSTIWMAGALSENGNIVTIEKDENSYMQAKSNFLMANLNDKINIIKDNAINVLNSLDIEFDMIFIDADKINYVNYLNWAEKHIRNGGLIVADNTLLSGAVYMKKLPYRIRKTARDTIKEFNIRLSNKEKYTSILLPSTDGIIIAVKNF